MKLCVDRGAVIFALGAVAIGLIGIWRGGMDADEVASSVVNVLSVGAAALVHELGHIAVARLCGTPIRRLRLDLFGARMDLGGWMSYRREMAVAAGGPAVGLLACMAVWPLASNAAGKYAESCALFVLASLTLSLLNLLPVATLDGGRMLRCFLCGVVGERVADAVLRVTSTLVVGTLWLLSVYALLRTGEMLTIFAFSLCLLCRLVSPDAAADWW